MCNCIEQIDEQLEKQVPGLRLGTDMHINFETGKSGVTVGLQLVPPPKVKGKRQPRIPAMIATFCPFCAAKYKRP